MAPACRGGRRKAHCKQWLARQPKTLKPSQEFPPTASNSSKQLAKLDMEEAGSKDAPLPGCSTPKAKRFRIPDHLPCPPAPKKRRLTALDCSSHRPSISFFNPPDIELFFLIALQGVTG